MNAPTSLHPTKQTLSSYGLGKLDDESTEAVNKHLEECPDCRKWVAEMSADSFLGRVRDVQAGKSTFGKSQTGGTQSDKGSSAPPPIDTMPPGLADHPDYEIKRELGRGGMGVVYLAHNRLMGRDEVLKVMGRQIMERPGVLDRFLREIRAVAKLRHPNIVTAYHATRLGESIVFAMEYVEGLDLAKMIKAKGPLPVGHACNFVYQSALGLQHAHDEGLVHRDIKPGNLMLSRKGNKATIKVLDFGLAKVTREEKVDGALTHEGQALGTPDFIAPEQILDATSADIRADIYSLGCTLYYLLSGRPPFQASSLYDMFQAHISRDADLLNFVRPEVPAELAALVAKMMAKDPARRFQTPGEVAEALTPFFKKGNVAFKGTKPEFSSDGQMAASRPETGAVSTPTERATDAGRPVVRAKKTTEPAVPEARWESLIEFRETERSVEEASKVEPPGRPPQLKWPIALAGSLFGLIALGVIIITIRDNNGRETKIIVPDDSTVSVEGARKNIEFKPSVDGREEERRDGPFVLLFNGKDKTGWVESPSNSGGWKVVDGVLQARGPGPKGTRYAVLNTQRQNFTNFRLHLKFRYPREGRGQIEIRHAHVSDSRNGYMINQSSWPTTDQWQIPTGSITKMRNHPYGSGIAWNRLAVAFPVPINTWNTMDITAVKARIVTSVNGKEVADYTDASGWFGSGGISLAAWYETVVEFQEITIEELPE